MGVERRVFGQPELSDPGVLVAVLQAGQLDFARAPVVGDVGETTGDVAADWPSAARSSPMANRIPAA